MTKLGMRDRLISEDPTFGHTIHIRAITADEWRQGAGVGQPDPYAAAPGDEHP